MAGDGTAVIARVGLDDRGFQEGVSKLQRGLKLVQSEFAVASSKLGDFGKSTEGLKLKADSLSKQIGIQRERVETLNRAYQQAVQAKGEDSKAAENLRIRLNNASAELNNMESGLSRLNREIETQSSNWTKLGKSCEDIGGKMKNIGEGFSKVGNTLTKTVTTPHFSGRGRAV